MGGAQKMRYLANISRKCAGVLNELSCNLSYVAPLDSQLKPSVEKLRSSYRIRQSSERRNAGQNPSSRRAFSLIARKLLNHPSIYKGPNTGTQIAKALKTKCF